MKKLVLVLAGLTLMTANSAMASKARLQALGQSSTGENGSYYINDERNILLNPAAITKFGNFALIEVGTAGDDSDSPDAQGGFVLQGGNLTYGLFLGHEDAALRDALTTAGVPAPSNTIEAFIGGQAGVAWGASVYYSAVEGYSETGDFDNDSTTADTTYTNAAAELSTFGLRLGATADMWQAFTHVGLGTKGSGQKDLNGDGTPETDSDFEGALSVKVGGSYNVGTGVIYGNYTMAGADVTVSPGTGDIDNESKRSSYELGWANTQEIEENAFFFYSVAYRASMSETDSSVDAQDTESTVQVLPFTLGFEADANTWLAFRGSVVQPIVLDKSDDGTNTISGGSNTTIGAGASLKFDRLRIDGTAFSGGSLDTSNLLGRVGLTYSF